MAPGRHGRRKRRSRRSKRQPESPELLLEQARQCLAKGDGRGALDRLRQARRGDADSVEWPHLHFCACIQRARQLARSGLDREAAAMRARALQYGKSISTRSLGEQDLVQYVGALDLVDALAVYADYLQDRPAVPEAERRLADRLVVRRHWDGLKALDAEHPLRRDIDQVVPSCAAMDTGEWERAAELLKGVPRRSPFAPWRVFCKAMVFFGAGDDENLRRSIDLLPADFALAHTVAELRRACSGEGGGGPAELRRALGTDGDEIAALADSLRRALRTKERPRVIEGRLIALADALYPDDPLQARVALLEIAGLATLRDRISPRTVHRLVRALVPPERVAGLSARIDLMLQQVSPDLWNPVPAAAYLDRLAADFPRTSVQALARARVLEALARTGRRAIQPEFLPPRMVEALETLLGEGAEEPGLLFAELMVGSLEADPDNREGYRFLIDLLHESRADKPRLRGILETMANRFPDDPDPWLELARLDYSTNAYRRAEHALTEARRRAPHDERIADLQAIGFLKSADQSRKSGRFARAAEDLERAGALGRKKIASLSRVKRILLEIVSAGRNAAEVVAPHLEDLAPGLQIRTLALLIHELEENSHVKNVNPGMERAVTGLLARRASLMNDLEADEIVGLLAPLPTDFRILYERLEIAPVLTRWWANLMRGLDVDRLSKVFDILMGCGGRASIRTEIERRLRGVKKSRRDPVLLLHMAVLRFVDGQDHDSTRFLQAVEAAGRSDRERLREAAMRLARHTQGILREALHGFDFRILDRPPPLFDTDEQESLDNLLNELFGAPVREERRIEASFEKFLDALRDGTPDHPSDNLPHQGSLFDDRASRELSALEALIDRYALRGLPPAVFEDFAESARTEPELRDRLEGIARGCEAAGLRRAASQEARALLFPRTRYG